MSDTPDTGASVPRHVSGTASREALLGAAFVKLADNLIDDFDMLDLLHTLIDECVRIFDVQAGGLLLADANGNLELLASSSEEAKLVEIMQLSAGAGPCVECFATGSAVAVDDIQVGANRWPKFSTVAFEQGFRSVYAAPMRLRGKTIGTLNLMSTAVGVLDPQDIVAVQALADAATITILQERLLRENTVLTEQLNRALTSRIFVEQAKGILSESESISIEDAFDLMRRFARDTSTPLHVIAERIATRRLKLGPTAGR
jgi:GAF domain-containing protein